MGRFFRRGKEVWVLAPAVANKAAPTRAEITAGVVLTEPGSDEAAGIAGIAGWSMSRDDIATPDAATDFAKTIPGVNSSEASSITFYDDDDDDTIREAQIDGTEGFMIRMPYGDVAAKRCSVWPVRSKGVNDDADIVTASDAAKFTVGYSIIGIPEKDAVIPAAGP